MHRSNDSALKARSTQQPQSQPIMLKTVAIAITVCCAFVLTTRGADKLTDEQKTERKGLIEKYDKNKDGKLDKEERGAMSAEDKEKLGKINEARKKKEEAK
jgi:hypothetical protein